MKSYTGKILLFGEYTIINGGEALAIPLYNFTGQWLFGDGDKKNMEWQKQLPDFLLYLKNLQNKNALLSFLNLDSFALDLKKGLYFDSSIPEGFGAGSSGALCAAIYDTYAKEKTNDLFSLQKTLAQLESFFHGSSSGIDPLVCLLQKPILIESKENLKQVELKPFSQLSGDFKKQDASFFLINTKIKRKTAPFVKIFNEKNKDSFFRKHCEAELIPYNEEAIHASLNGDNNTILNAIHLISHFQFKYFSEMIPESFRSIWLDSLDSDFYKLKICGAGGGGFILGFTNDFDRLSRKLDGVVKLQT